MAIQLSRARHDTFAKWRRRILIVLLTIVLLAFTTIVIIPFLWMLMLSLRTTGAILNDPYGLPDPIRWQNYTKLLFDPQFHFYQYFFNSVFVTAFAVLLNSILATMAGYGFGRPRYDFRFRGLLLLALLAALMLPPQILYIPQFVMMSRYGLIGTRWALVFLYAAGALPISVFLMSAYFSTLPPELEDAARIDGCGHFSTFWRVMLPLARPAILTVVLFNAMNFWNELLLAITMTPSPEMRTLPAQIWHFIGEHGVDYALASTSLVVAAAPILLLYLFFSERFIQGLTAGAVKG
jgi:ABC-type glycerol-3-phosphate transport system permease component